MEGRRCSNYFSSSSHFSCILEFLQFCYSWAFFLNSKAFYLTTLFSIFLSLRSKKRKKKQKEFSLLSCRNSPVCHWNKVLSNRSLCLFCKLSLDFKKEENSKVHHYLLVPTIFSALFSCFPRDAPAGPMMCVLTLIMVFLESGKADCSLSTSGLQVTGSQRVRHNGSNLAHARTHTHTHTHTPHFEMQNLPLSCI